MSYTIEVPDVPPSLNQVLRMHWAVKKRLGEDWYVWIFARAPRGMKSGERKMAVKIILHNARQFDKDNAYGACKVVFDALKKLGLIHNDRPEFLESSVEQVKCHRDNKRTVIEIGAA